MALSVTYCLYKTVSGCSAARTSVYIYSWLQHSLYISAVTWCLRFLWEWVTFSAPLTASWPLEDSKWTLWYIIRVYFQQRLGTLHTCIYAVGLHDIMRRLSWCVVNVLCRSIKCSVWLHVGPLSSYGQACSYVGSVDTREGMCMGLLPWPCVCGVTGANICMSKLDSTSTMCVYVYILCMVMFVLDMQTPVHCLQMAYSIERALTICTHMHSIMVLNSTKESTLKTIHCI